jgi:hypothetical protein
MKSRPPQYYQEAFESWIKPVDADKIVKAIKSSGPLAAGLCTTNFPNSQGNSQWAKGTNRKQFIEDILRGTTFDGDLFVQVRDYTGRFMEDEDKNNNFLLLKSAKYAAIIWYSRPMKLLPGEAAFNRHLAALPESREEPLFPPEYLFGDHLPTELDAFFVIRYELDKTDETRTKIGKIDVVVPLSDCQTIYCYPCIDLELYAGRAILDAQPELSVELRDDVDEAIPVINTPIIEAPSERTSEQLKLEFKMDLEE